jgi:hypothetical protein
LEAPEEDSTVVEMALELYKDTMNAARKRRAGRPESYKPLDAGSPRPVSLTIEDSEPFVEGTGRFESGEEAFVDAQNGITETERGNGSDKEKE